MKRKQSALERVVKINMLPYSKVWGTALAIWGEKFYVHNVYVQIIHAAKLAVVLIFNSMAGNKQANAVYFYLCMIIAALFIYICNTEPAMQHLWYLSTYLCIVRAGKQIHASLPIWAGLGIFTYLGVDYSASILKVDMHLLLHCWMRLP